MGYSLSNQQSSKKMSACMLVMVLLATSCTSLPTRQRYASFKNFPVVGIKENHEVEAPVEKVEEMVDTENVARAARQVAPNSYTEALDDTFVEEAIYLTPADRDARGTDIDSWEYSDDEIDDAGETSNVDLENFELIDESLPLEENERAERDGAHGSHGPHGPARHSARNSRRFQQQQVPEEQDFRQPLPQEQRGGRQTGQVGAALGVLSNPPSAKGDYNFNFSNDDGSSRQESGAPDGISGSYSFITPEGENVSVQYVADETGFHATGSHVPQAPPMPPHVQRLLDHLAKVNGLPRL